MKKPPRRGGGVNGRVPQPQSASNRPPAPLVPLSTQGDDSAPPVAHSSHRRHTHPATDARAARRVADGGRSRRAMTCGLCTSSPTRMPDGGSVVSHLSRHLTRLQQGLASGRTRAVVAALAATATAGAAAAAAGGRDWSGSDVDQLSTSTNSVLADPQQEVGAAATTTSNNRRTPNLRLAKHFIAHCADCFFCPHDAVPLVWSSDDPRQLALTQVLQRLINEAAFASPMATQCAHATLVIQPVNNLVPPRDPEYSKLTRILQATVMPVRVGESLLVTTSAESWLAMHFGEAFRLAAAEPQTQPEREETRCNGVAGDAAFVAPPPGLEPPQWKECVTSESSQSDAASAKDKTP